MTAHTIETIVGIVLTVVFGTLLLGGLIDDIAILPSRRRRRRGSSRRRQSQILASGRQAQEALDKLYAQAHNRMFKTAMDHSSKNYWR